MDESEKQRYLEVLEQECHEQRVPFTMQRRAILEVMLELDSHPTADEVHEAVTRRMLRISRTTVYRTLETLARMGVITKLCHPGSVVRYDVRTELHHHLVCMSCNEVVDISDRHLDSMQVPDTSSLGFEVTDFRVQLRGTCRRCAQLKGR